MSDPSKPKRKSALVAAARAQAKNPSSSVTATNSSQPQTQSRSIINLSGQGTTFSAERPSSPTVENGGQGDAAVEQDVKPDTSASIHPPESEAGGSGSGSRSGQVSPDKSSVGGGGAGDMSRASSASGSSTPILGSANSTPRLEGGSTIQKMKFKPRVPVRARVKTEPDVKPDISIIPSSQPTRGAARGRGRGVGQRGGDRRQNISVAAGVFGAPRPQPKQAGRRIAPAPAPRNYEFGETDVYSDNESDPTSGSRIIDIDEVSTIHESAPTSLLRNRRDRSKSKSRSRRLGTIATIRSSSQSQSQSRAMSRVKSGDGQSGGMEVDDGGVRVKDEPVSPEKRATKLADLFPDEESGGKGDRVRSFARHGGVEGDDEGVDEANKVDLSESESEEEEEDLRDDFMDNDDETSSDRFYMFQFPHLFPRFVPSGPVDLTKSETKGPGGEEDVKPDVKPTAAQLRAKKKEAAKPPPEGRIGTLVVMKSGKVKMVLGKDIVMDVNPGVQTNFLQQIVHLDSSKKSADVLGEVHKQYTVTPDIDRLLHELYIHGGQTPADKEAERKRLMKDVKVERGLVKMEVD